MLPKALRAFQMYESNNPVFRHFQDALRDSLVSLWSRADELELAVHEDGFEYRGRRFPVGSGRDSLAYSFHKDGIRYLKFLPGFEDEVGPFLAAIQRARRRDDDENDMVAVLWEADLSAFEYRWVDLLTGAVAMPEAPGGGAAGALAAIPSEVGAEEAVGEPADRAAIGLTRDDFDDTLYFLGRAELATLAAEVEAERGRDLRRGVLNALLDRLEDASSPVRQEEIMDILDQLLPMFLSRGELTYAVQILDELDRLSKGAADSNLALVERVEKLFSRLEDQQVLEQFVRALEDGAVSPDSHEVGLFFSRLRDPALPVLIRFAEATADPAVASRLASAIDGVAARYPATVASLLASEDTVLVKGAARAAGRTKMTRAVDGLKNALSHRDPTLRLVAVKALALLRSPSSLQALIGPLRDEDREVRIAAARALGALGYVSARDALWEALGGRRLRDADLTEKLAFFEAYGAVGGSVAAERLGRMLNGKGFLGRRTRSDLRACAALGLGQLGTVEARAALEKGRFDDDPVVRNAVLRALQEDGQ